MSNAQFNYQGDEHLIGTYAVNGLNQYQGVGDVDRSGDLIPGKHSAFSYDVKGNFTSDGWTTYSYDTENRLKTAAGSDNATLTYDPNGRMVKLVSGGNTTRFVYDGDALIGEYNGSGNMLKRYVHGSGVDDPLVMFDGSSVADTNLQYLHSDYQGSIVALSDSNNELTGINTYDVYGIPHSSNQGRFAYTGQLALPELGMYYYKARIYHPKLGRFLQTDPIGYDDGMNMYAYVGNDPVNLNDPSGENAVAVARFSYRAGQSIGNGINIATKALTGASLSTHIANAIYDAVHNEGADDWEADYEDWANGNSDDTTDHGKERGSRGVDKDKTRKNGEKFRDTESGGIVYVDGNNVVIDGEEGNMTSWGDQTEKETTGKVGNGNQLIKIKKVF